MAKEKEIPINTKVKVDAKDAGDSIEDFGKKVEKLRRTSRGAAKQSTKDWGGFANLFSGLLPRNVQMMIRKFQSTTRQVGRLSKSLKFLKGAFAGLGIGLLIIALETLIDRWDDITRLISGVTKEQERYNDVVKAGSKALDEYNTRNAEYIRIVKDSSEQTDVRSEALNTLATSLREVRDLDIETADGLERFNKAVERQVELVGIQGKEQEILNQITELRNEKDAVQLSWYDYLANKKDRQAKLDAAKAEKDAEINAKIAEYNALQLERLGYEAEITAELDRQAKEQEYLRWLEQSRLKYGKDWEFQMEQMGEAEDEFFEDQANNELMAQFRRDQALEERNRKQKEADEEMYDEMDRQYWENYWKKSAADEKALQDELRRLDLIAQARNANFRAAENISTQLERLAEDGTNAQKAFAITSVLLSQAQAVQSAITGALKAAEATNAAAPFTAPLFIAQMVGIALSSFAQVKSILQQAGASTGGAVQRGGGGGGQTQALVPQGTGGRQQQLPQVNQSYVVQSQLQGMMQLQSGLEKRLHL